MNKNVCYTCITGNYDNLIDPIYISKDWDYICFTNNKKLVSNVWEIKYIPDFLNCLDNYRINRYIKILPHIILNKYRCSLYVDGNILINGDLNVLIKKYNKASIYIKKHESRNCIYKELSACVTQNKDIFELMINQINTYANEGYPLNYGLTHNNIILRYHNNDICKIIMNNWWNEVLLGSFRDQLSLFYVLWKFNYKDSLINFNDDDLKIFKTNQKHINKQKYESYNIINFDDPKIKNLIIFDSYNYNSLINRLYK